METGISLFFLIPHVWVLCREGKDFTKTVICEIQFNVF